MDIQPSHRMERLPPYMLGKIKKLTYQRRREGRDVIDLMDEIVARGAPVQANRTLAVIRRMFNFAVDRDVIPFSPCHRVKPPSAENSKDRYLTLDEIRLFWNRLDSVPIQRRTALALKLLLVTLQRSSEVLGARKSEFDLENRTWIISAERTKNKRAHVVPLSPMAMNIMTELLADASDSPFLIPGRAIDKPMANAALSRAIARSCTQNGLMGGGLI